MLQSVSSSVRSRLMRSRFNHILIFIIFLYIAQLVYLGYNKKIDTTMIVIESLFAIKLLLLYIKNVIGNEENDLSRGRDSSESFPATEEEIENSIQQSPNEPT